MTEEERKQRTRERWRQWRAANPERARLYAKRWNTSPGRKAAAQRYQAKRLRYPKERTEEQRLKANKRQSERYRKMITSETGEEKRLRLARNRERMRAYVAEHREHITRLARERRANAPGVAERRTARLIDESVRSIFRQAQQERKRINREQLALTRDDRRREARKLKMRRYRAKYPEKARTSGRRQRENNLERYRELCLKRKRKYEARITTAVRFLRVQKVLPRQSWGFKLTPEIRQAALAYVRQAGLLPPP